ncbi:peptidylprolyl isomerase [Micromonospora saelicesensis]|uniref:Peptidyl-prolyl cis-trans isomerase n=1 Tax=Micromonospora saelicesensis TaxID=285676 RepID=A0A1C4ZTE4_9ACTN|nr:peptidylprolyl isomerase [Micromonospora saelicesensis]SCF36252.1 peptidyl-prolyl cis-trans isomerase B (cyclophilin B) [Micromonospora saelicesensis]
MSSELEPRPAVAAPRRPVRALTRLAGVTVLAGALVVGASATALATPGPSAEAERVSAAPLTAVDTAVRPPRTTHGPCAYTETPEEPAARPVPLPPDPRRTPARGSVRVTLATNHGPIGLTVDRAAAPCTVQSFLHLVNKRFYDRTPCHRLTAYPTLSVLQCGDPSGTGEGGPGYRYRDELPTDLPPAPTDPTGERRVYARGVLAMANAGPDTNGSQFFLVYANSALRPNYTIFGEVDGAGLATLDRIAAGGVAPTAEDPAPVDGAPALPVTIRKAVRWHHH